LPIDFGYKQSQINLHSFSVRHLSVWYSFSWRHMLLHRNLDT